MADIAKGALWTHAPTLVDGDWPIPVEEVGPGGQYVLCVTATTQSLDEAIAVFKLQLAFTHAAATESRLELPSFADVVSVAPTAFAEQLHAVLGDAADALEVRRALSDTIVEAAKFDDGDGWLAARGHSYIYVVSSCKA